MNVKITKEQHGRLCKTTFKEYLFGSRLFGTHSKESDYDYIRVYNYDNIFNEWDYYLPNIHSFQYDSVEENIQYIWMTERQFWGNLYSGDGTMISDILLFSGEFSKKFALDWCRTFKVIRAYCGVAKRDVKLHPNSENKRFHATRSLYIADCLIKNILPSKTIIKHIKKTPDSVEEINTYQKELRDLASSMYQNKELHNYYIPDTEDDLLEIMLKANNTREFKYD